MQSRKSDGANLDRIQIIKGWVDDAGAQQEEIYNIALSDDRQPAPDGTIPPVGNTVDAKDASYSNAIGDVELNATWTDPDFDSSLPAVYYVRVLQIPTPRWSTYDVGTHWHRAAGRSSGQHPGARLVLTDLVHAELS